MNRFVSSTLGNETVAVRCTGLLKLRLVNDMANIFNEYVLELPC